jgi:L-amino acid N-acyltransferase YncA
MRFGRPRRNEDLATITAVYAHHVRLARARLKSIPSGLIRCPTAGSRKAMAVIAESTQADPVGAPRSLSLTPVRIIAPCGGKRGVWRDIAIMQKLQLPGIRSLRLTGGVLTAGAAP